MTTISFGKPPTLHDLAKAAGVSKGTASNVFNRPDIVREEVRERVLETAKSIGYRGPDPIGRVLSAGKVNAIGVATVQSLSYFFEDPFARVLMAGITKACEESGTGVSLVSAAGEEELAWNMQSAVVDGFILFCLEGADKLIESSRERHLPFVALAFREGDEEMSVVSVDDMDGARRAAEHLLGLGHRRFAILGMELEEYGTGRTATVRTTGYLEAIEAAGIDQSGVHIMPTDGSPKTVAPALETLFALAEPPTAILAQSDRIALFALGWLQERGISVPDDVSIVGYDGVPESAISDPPLTTIQQPIEQIGQHAVRVILDHPGAVWRETLATELVVRGTTAPPKR